EAESIAGFTRGEAEKLFPVSRPEILNCFSIISRPPAESRRAYITRFDELMALADKEPAGI
ncbi:MAG: hypothetical protein Q4G49_00785, partial [Paracoccus sp. (in: a-proteobacteria)]|nr:hypothetical protein [Paracoccus sp. (in: a-proteobacteria)]